MVRRNKCFGVSVECYCSQHSIKGSHSRMPLEDAETKLKILGTSRYEQESSGVRTCKTNHVAARASSAVYVNELLNHFDRRGGVNEAGAVRLE